ncbi:HAMP domain-containing sensor histidine kinase [Paenibacillus puerhi]|uniref:HAMP domain-containing sensor histidine kinase n=1 Tax=Paenibacillus puerhi TaxID=2692622 RepID=UPI00135A7847|nr:HAMP domain-containing sensor histidine kinase [Paenibacillus puerhi]
MAISGLMLVTIALSLFGMDLLMNRYVDRTADLNEVNGAEMYRYPFDNIDGRLLDQYGGWLEIVDEAGSVIYVKGSKEDDIVQYSGAQLYAKLDILRNDDSIHYHAYPVEGPRGEAYVMLWKIPERLEMVSTAFGLFAALFAVLLFVALYVYARYSVRQIKKPLQQIVDGIKEMEHLNYKKRLDFSAEQEFAEIREAFNKMAERLQSTSAEKEAAEHHKRNMLLHLSHDLKTPITSILGYSQLLLETKEADEGLRRKYVQYMYDKSAYMSHLIQDLFELAKLDDPQLKLNRETVNMAEWFRHMLAECYPELEAKGFQLEAHIPEEPLPVRLDKRHMNRVAANLIGNALKYNPPGTTLYASCERRGGYAVLVLGDDGTGVPEQIRDHIFDEFVRGHSGVKDNTGLGLAICKKIITLHQGTIELLEDPSYSTLFRISLPCEHEAARGASRRT